MIMAVIFRQNIALYIVYILLIYEYQRIRSTHFFHGITSLGQTQSLSRSHCPRRSPSPFFPFFTLSFFMAGEDSTPVATTHPTLNVSNIKTFIPVVLELESSQYGS